MTARRKPPPKPEPPAFNGETDHVTIIELGLAIMSYRSEATERNAEGRSWWIPQHLAGADLALILWHPVDGRYSIGGWEPQLGPNTHGGHYERLANALAWVRRARDVRDGKARDFLGV